MVGGTRRLGRARGIPDSDHAADAHSSEFLEEIERLTATNRAQRDADTERLLVRLRHLAAIRLIEESTRTPEYAVPAFDRLPESQPLVDIPATGLTPGVLRAGILRDGCVLVRGLVEREVALRFAEMIERAFTERDLCAAGRPFADAFFEEFSPEPAYAETLA